MASAATHSAHADDEITPVVIIPSPLIPGETSPPPQPAPNPTGEPVPPVSVPDPGPIAAPEPIPSPDPTPQPISDPAPAPDPAPSPQPVADPLAGALPSAVQLSTAEAPIPDGGRSEQTLAPVVPPPVPPVAASELVPSAEPTPSPTITSEQRAVAAPISVPEPVVKTIDAVVTTATGSPLYVQLLTVFLLIGAGIAYFRLIGSKGTRIPSKTVK